MTTTTEAAILLKAWAQEKNLMGHDYPAPLDRNDPQTIINLQSMSVFSHSESIFRQKQISNIACNDQASIIYILTKKVIAKKDIDSLPKYLFEDIRIEYLHAGQAHIGNPSSLNPISSYTVTREGKYTCGSSIHPARFIGAGTLGCLVKDGNGQMYGLTNNHVSGNCSYSLIGEKILAPGHIDIQVNSIDPFTIGHHFQSLPFVPGTPDNINVSLNLDAALIKIVDEDRVSSFQGSAYDTPIEIAELTSGLSVEKVGRTSGHTQGFVIAECIGPFSCNYTVHSVGGQVAWFENVFIVRSNVENFSEPGDSGSLVVAEINGERKAVGLVFAGDQQGNSYILPLRKVLENFGVTIFSGHNI